MCGYVYFEMFVVLCGGFVCDDVFDVVVNLYKFEFGCVWYVLIGWWVLEY